MASDLTRKDQSRAPSGDYTPQITPKGNIPGSQPALPPWFQPNPHIDRTHDVPLAAAALSDADGSMYGIAIDKDAPHKPEYDPYIYQHEWQEHHYMQDLMANGTDPVDAYHKAHDHITPMESAAVQAQFGEQGLEDYKQYWRDVSSVAGAKENPDRHPDAHTTIHGLDEAELGTSYPTPAQAKSMTHEAPSPLPPIIQNLMSTPSWVERATKFNESVKGKKLSEYTPAEKEEALGLVSGFGGAGIMAGEKALTATGLSRAIQLESAGKNADSIFVNTGWFRGADNKWRFEIDDSKAKLNLLPLTRQHPVIDKLDLSYKKGVPLLEDIFDHPDLFKNYPFLRNVRVLPLARGGDMKGAYSRDFNTILLNLNSGTQEEIKSTLIHEVQHAVQNHEGFARGAGIHDLLPPQKTRPELTDAEWNEAHSRALDQYYNTMGEVESRNAQDRMTMGPGLRRLVPPYATEDVPRHLQRENLGSYRDKYTPQSIDRSNTPVMASRGGHKGSGGRAWKGSKDLDDLGAFLKEKANKSSQAKGSDKSVYAQVGIANWAKEHGRSVKSTYNAIRQFFPEYRNPLRVQSHK